MAVPTATIAELDEEYIGRMEDVLALYENPLSEEEPVVCIDEKPVVLHTDVRLPRPMRPGQVLRRDSEYKREGTANVFCGVEPKAGGIFPNPQPRARRRSLPITWWRSSPAILKRGPSTW